MYIIADPLPSSTLAQKLCQIFSHPWHPIEAASSGNEKPNWRTIQNYPLKPRSLWAKYLSPLTLIGVRFGQFTNYGMIDVDQQSPYCNPAGVARIQAALETIGIVRTITIRSSPTGGLHLYIPLPGEVPSFDLATSLQSCLESHGLELHPGHLEIFPNVKRWANWLAGEFSEYNAHRLPLQPGGGGCMLNSGLSPKAGGLELFLAAWDFATGAQDLDLLRPALKHGRNNHRKRKKQRTHPVTEWLQDLDTTINEGFTAIGQTNSLLKDIGCKGRVFLRLAGDELATYIHETITALPGYHQFCRHQHEIAARVRNWATAVEKYYWPMGSKGERVNIMPTANAIRQEEARNRIAATIDRMKADGIFPELASKRFKLLVKLAKASGRTLYKNVDLWHPKKEAVTTEPAGDPRLLQLDIPDITEPPEPSENHGLPPEPPLMKGVSMKIPPKNCSSEGREGGEGGREGKPPDDPPP